MNVTALRVGTVEIKLKSGFESQGFAVTDVTGLSDYGEHKMGVPGSNDIVITGVILPGANPMAIRAYLFTSTNPFVPVMLEAVYQNGVVYQSLGAITSVKCNIHDVPVSVVVTIRKRTCWYASPNIIQLTSDGQVSNIMTGTFECSAPITLEIQLTSYFSRDNLKHTSLVVAVGERSSITVDFSKIEKILPETIIGLFDGSVIRITNSLDYHACLITDGVVYDLPVLGKVVNGMIPPSVDPEITYTPSIAIGCSVGVAMTARQTFLTL